MAVGPVGPKPPVAPPTGDMLHDPKYGNTVYAAEHSMATRLWQTLQQQTQDATKSFTQPKSEDDDDA
jgi:hypothetical protein